MSWSAAALDLAAWAFRKSDENLTGLPGTGRLHIPKWTKLTKQVINLNSKTVAIEKQGINPLMRWE